MFVAAQEDITTNQYTRQHNKRRNSNNTATSLDRPELAQRLCGAPSLCVGCLHVCAGMGVLRLKKISAISALSRRSYLPFFPHAAVSKVLLPFVVLGMGYKTLGALFTSRWASGARAHYCGNPHNRVLQIRVWREPPPGTNAAEPITRPSRLQSTPCKQALGLQASTAQPFRIPSGSVVCHKHSDEGELVYFDEKVYFVRKDTNGQATGKHPRAHSHTAETAVCILLLL